MKMKLRQGCVRGRLPVFLAVVMAVGVLACGGGGGDSDDNDLRGGALEVPVLEGLEGDADNQRRLFFTSSVEGSQGLYALNPRTLELGAELVDDKIELRSFHYQSIHGGTIQGSTKTLEDFHVAHILYSVRAEDDPSGESMPPFMRGELRRVSSDSGPDAVVSVRVGASEESAAVLAQTKRYIHFDLQHPMNSTFLYRDIQQDGWVRVKLDDEPTVVPAYFGEDVTVISWAMDIETPQDSDWLVIHEKDGGKLERVDSALNSVGPVRYKESGEAVEGVTVGQPIHHLEGGEQLLVLGFDSSRESGELWLYETDGSASHGGTIRALLNADGERLVFAFQALVEGLGLPSDDLSTSHQGAYFFADGPSMFNATWTRLYRIDAQGWSVYEHSREGSTGSMDSLLYSNLGPFLIDAGDAGLIWSLGGNVERVSAPGADVSAWTREVVDSNTGGDPTTPVYSMSNGWIYYNGEQGERQTIDIAVALNVRTNERLVLKNTQWIGASSNGKGSLVGRQIGIGLSEVFAVRNGRALIALSAQNPGQGAVILGELPATVEKVTMYGAGSGPHRLIGVEHENQGYEVVYVNTRASDSLVHLMEKLAVDWDETLEYTNFGGTPGSMELDVSGSYTRPLNLF